MLKKSVFLLLFLVLSLSGFAQFQTVRGEVRDAQSSFPLIGATIEWLNDDSSKGSVSDIDGKFFLEDIPLGRQDFRVSYLGYESAIYPNLILSAGKELWLDIALEESSETLTEVLVIARVDNDKTQNEMATVSARQFSLEEVNRFSGGRNDVARLASNLAGVSTSNDARNDIVIRGNSPIGVLWRLEGVAIPNPNHFSTLGTTGGPVSAVNTNLLRNSDFMTGAFAAEYGNALSGVFDLGFRIGNKNKYEFTGMSGFSGLEFMAEGPLQKEKSSFLISYRHSMVEIIDLLGFSVGTAATPKYKDLSFNIDLGKTPIGKISVFGIGGLSDIEFLSDEINDGDLFADPTRDSRPSSKLGIVGLKHSIIIGENSYVRTVLSASTERSYYDQDGPVVPETKMHEIENTNETNFFKLASFFNSKLSNKLTLRTGLNAHQNQINTVLKSRDNTPDMDGDGIPDWFTYRDYSGTIQLYEAYAQLRYKIHTNLTLHTGIHSQYLPHNKSRIIEPRLALNWQVTSTQSISFGYGLHSQMQPMPVFFTKIKLDENHFEGTNDDLDFTKSHQFVLAYDLKFAENWRIKAEAYYQKIFDVPVEVESSSFSMLNAGADFVFPFTGKLKNTGTGENIGIEFTLEKFFSNGYYGLLTASVFDSKYTGSDGVERNTAFNSKYVFNVLGGKEFEMDKNGRHTLTLDTKLTTAGGRPYTPVDLEASVSEGEEVKQDEEAFSLFYEDYFRLDAKIGYRLNSAKKRLSHFWFVDFQNITNRKNIFNSRYNRVTGEINNSYQIGFFPVFMYRIEF